VSTHCSQCKAAYGARSYPRFIRDDRDARTTISRQETVMIGTTERRIAWVERITCDCQWRMQLRLVDTQLMELLLPDPQAQQEIRRRAA